MAKKAAKKAPKADLKTKTKKPQATKKVVKDKKKDAPAIAEEKDITPVVEPIHPTSLSEPSQI